jgi:hypothetical protein
MGTAFGFAITYPVAALIIVAVAALPISIAIISSGSRKRALRRESEQMVVKMQHDAEMRKTLILERYEPEIARRILNRQIWKGMTAEQLSDSMGQPDEVDEVVTKRTQKQIWKYDQVSASRFDTRITLEGGVVVGWQMR